MKIIVDTSAEKPEVTSDEEIDLVLWKKDEAVEEITPTVDIEVVTEIEDNYNLSKDLSSEDEPAEQPEETASVDEAELEA